MPDVFAFNALMGFAAWGAIFALFAVVIALFVGMLWLIWRGLKCVAAAWKAARSPDPSREPRAVRRAHTAAMVSHRQ